ncbi:MAG: hypothetical protein P8009_04115 [Gammaproteobacteria bacterium]
MSNSIARAAGVVLALFALGAQAGSYINAGSYNRRDLIVRGSNMTFIQFDGHPLRDRLVRAPTTLSDGQIQLPWRLRVPYASVQAVEKFEVYGKSPHGRSYSLFQWHRGEIPVGTSAWVNLAVPGAACGQTLKLHVKVLLRYKKSRSGRNIHVITDDAAQGAMLSVDCAKPSRVQVSFRNDYSNTFHNYFSADRTDYSVLRRGAVPGEQSCMFSSSVNIHVAARDDLGIKRVVGTVGGVRPKKRIFGVKPQRHFRGSWKVTPLGNNSVGRTEINVAAYDRAGAYKYASRRFKIAEQRPEDALKIFRYPTTRNVRVAQGHDVVLGGGLETTDCALLQLIRTEGVRIGWVIKERHGRRVASGNIRLRGRRTPFVVRAHRPPTGVYHLELVAKNGGSPHKLRYQKLDYHTVTVYPVVSQHKARQMRSSPSGAHSGPAGHLPTPQFGH